MDLRNSWDCPIAFYSGQDMPGTSIYEYIESCRIPRSMLFDGTEHNRQENSGSNGDEGDNVRSVFSRIEHRKYPHDIIADLRMLATEFWPTDDSGAPYEPALPALRFSDEASTGDATGVEVVIAYNTAEPNDGGESNTSEFGHFARYVYDVEEGHYKRWYNSEPQVDGLTGKEIIADNVIVLYGELTYCSNQASRPIWNLTGEGRLDVFIGGEHISGTSRRTDDTSQFEYLEESGNPLLLKPGITFIQVVQEEMEINHRSKHQL